MKTSLFVILFIILFTIFTSVQEVVAPPQLSERDTLVLTVLQQQIEIATLRLQKAGSDLKKPGWRVDLVNNRWQYIPDPVKE